jgi:hypothetical protein
MSGDTHQLKAGRRLPALAAWIDGHPLRAKGDVESERGAFCTLAKIGKERAQRIDFDIEPAPLDDGNIRDRRPFYDKDETGALTYLESVLGNHPLRTRSQASSEMSLPSIFSTSSSRVLSGRRVPLIRYFIEPSLTSLSL